MVKECFQRPVSRIVFSEDQKVLVQLQSQVVNKIQVPECEIGYNSIYLFSNSNTSIIFLDLQKVEAVKGILLGLSRVVLPSRNVESLAGKYKYICNCNYGSESENQTNIGLNRYLFYSDRITLLTRRHTHTSNL